MKFKREVVEKFYSKLEKEEVNGEVQYYRKRKVYPPFAEDGTIKWKEFLIGNWKTFAIVIAIVGITLGAVLEYILNLRTGMECINRENLIHNTLNFINVTP